MARRNLTVTVTSATVLFFLFTFAFARAPLDLPENDVPPTTTTTIRHHNLVDLSESDPKTTIVLPSEKPETEPATFVELEPEETEVLDSKVTVKQDTSESDHQTDSVPLTVITFRPINRHFARRPLFPFRRGRGCHGRRHHHRFDQFKLIGDGGPRQKEVSYGDDMISSGGEDFSFERRIPERWTRFNHGGNRFSLMNEEGKREGMNGRPHHHHHHHHHHNQDEEEEGEVKRHNHDHYKGGFMKRIRKFLNNF